ncbi:MAG: hypothetical protein QXL94_08795, partial [Candidatus Parvarchaeum sp.]
MAKDEYSIKAKMKRKKQSKPTAEEKIERRYKTDRKKNIHDETVKNQTTGKVFHETHEHLNEHNSHGSAKMTLKFTDVPGFSRAFILGGIVSIFILLLDRVQALYWPLLILVFILLIYAQRSIKFKNKKRYNTFVFATTALLGFVLGGILLYLMEKHTGLFDWIIPFIIIAFIIFVLLGALSYRSSPVILINDTIVESVPAEYYYYLNFSVYNNSMLSGAYSSTGPINTYILTSQEFDSARIYGLNNTQSIWQLTNSDTGSFAIS